MSQEKPQGELERRLAELVEQKEEPNKDKLCQPIDPPFDYTPSSYRVKRGAKILAYVGLGLIAAASIFGGIKGVTEWSKRERPVSYYEDKYVEIEKAWEENKEYKQKSFRGIAQSMIIHGEELDQSVNKPLEKLKKELKDKENPKLKEIYAKALGLDQEVNKEIVSNLENGYFFQAGRIRDQNFDRLSENNEREALHQFYKGVFSDIKRYSHDPELFSALYGAIGGHRNKDLK